MNKLKPVHDTNQTDEMEKAEKIVIDTAHRIETKKKLKDSEAHGDSVVVEPPPGHHVYNKTVNDTATVVANETATLKHSKATSYEANDTVLEKKPISDQTSNKTLGISNETNKTLQAPVQEQAVGGIDNGEKKVHRRGNQKIKAKPKKRRAKDAAEDKSPLPQQLKPVPDPLAHTPKKKSVKALPFSPKVPYLGVLVDAGRQYYSIDWLKRLIDYLHYMRFNLIHFRLTDDQAFNIRLDSHPEFAKASAVYANGTVYTPVATTRTCCLCSRAKHYNHAGNQCSRTRWSMAWYSKHAGALCQLYLRERLWHSAQCGAPSAVSDTQGYDYRNQGHFSHESILPLWW